MVRTQIQLTEDQHRLLRSWARQRGVSLAEAVRRCVADQLMRTQAMPSRADLVRAALAVCGKYSDDEGDRNIARDHDRYLAQAYAR